MQWKGSEGSIHYFQNDVQWKNEERTACNYQGPTLAIHWLTELSWKTFEAF